MSVWLTPDLKPVFGGTYFPPSNRYFGQPGFMDLLIALSAQVCHLNVHVVFVRYSVKLTLLCGLNFDCSPNTFLKPFLVFAIYMTLTYPL